MIIYGDEPLVYLAKPRKVHIKRINGLWGFFRTRTSPRPFMVMRSLNPHKTRLELEPAQMTGSREKGDVYDER